MAFWVDSLSVGIPALDLQHREFLELCESYQGALVAGDAGWRGIADAIMRHTIEHFRDEEAALVDIGYARDNPGPFMLHVGEHLQLKARIYTVLEAQGDAAEIIALLVQHLLKQDMKYKSYVQQHHLARS